VNQQHHFVARRSGLDAFFLYATHRLSCGSYAGISPFHQRTRYTGSVSRARDFFTRDHAVRASTGTHGRRSVARAGALDVATGVDVFDESRSRYTGET
jgi:hypothetical protein